ncbi:MAG: DUF4102 domain-containing protein, partial [Comamonadaceae bacterium]
PDVTLAQAREKAREARGQIEKGADPILARQEARSALAVAKSKAKTFDDCAAAFLKAKSKEWKNPKHGAQWQTTLDYAGESIGQLLVKDIGVAQVLEVLEPIWHTKTETASRLRGRIENVLDFATARGYRTGDNPARWRGHLDQLLAAPKKIKPVRHHPAVPYGRAGLFMAKLREVEGMSARALEFAVLTASRSIEVRGAVWSEFDLGARLWTVPAERMKGKKEHRVALSTRAVELLEALPRTLRDAVESEEEQPPEFVFPGRAGLLSDMSMTNCMRRLGFRDAAGRMCVPHGCRSTFRDWAGEETTYPKDLAEMALAHTIESAVEAAYRRGDMLEKRQPMMEDWARFCDMREKPKPNFMIVNGQVLPYQDPDLQEKR